MVEKAKADKAAREKAKAEAGGNMPIIIAVIVAVLALVYMNMQ
jgi:hypothetical protein